MLKTVSFLLTVLVSGSSQQCFSSNDTAPLMTSYTQSLWSDNQRHFSSLLFKYLNEENKEENVIFSPSSVYEILLLAYFGAAHETEESLASVLQIKGFLEKRGVWSVYRTLRLKTSQQDMKTYPLKTANKLFFSNKLSLRSCMKENFNKEIEIIDYQTGQAKNYINKWVEDETEGEIKDFFNELSSASTLTLVNAVMFKAKWENEFDPKFTKDLPFHVNSKITKTTSLMSKTKHFYLGHIDSINARALKMPYKGDRQFMFIILPNKDLDKTLKLMDSHALRNINVGLQFKKLFVEVKIPKFTESSEIPLNAALRKLGIGNAIDDNADYSRFTGKKEVSFNAVKQKAMIQVDEEGTKATAVSGVGSYNSSPLHTESFICDRPFAYYIYDSFTDTILFMGTFRQPK